VSPRKWGWPSDIPRGEGGLGEEMGPGSRCGQGENIP
jgi:hypothetical protein